MIKFKRRSCLSEVSAVFSSQFNPFDGLSKTPKGLKDGK